MYGFAGTEVLALRDPAVRGALELHAGEDREVGIGGIRERFYADPAAIVFALTEDASIAARGESERELRQRVRDARLFARMLRCPPCSSHPAPAPVRMDRPLAT